MTDTEFAKAFCAASDLSRIANSLFGVMTLLEDAGLPSTTDQVNAARVILDGIVRQLAEQAGS